MDRFFKPAASAPQKRGREEESSAPSNAAAAAPISIRSICCWNANSLLNRLKLNKSEVTDFLKSRKPDILFISEVRMPARGPNNCRREDGKPRLRGQFSDDKKDREDADLVRNWARECGCGNCACIAVCCCELDAKCSYHMFLSLSDWRYAGVALLVQSTCEQVVCSPALPAVHYILACCVLIFLRSLQPCDIRWISKNRRQSITLRLYIMAHHLLASALYHSAFRV
jgi:hypothetical protein